MSDPRELINKDPYDRLTSDEDEELEIQEQIEEIERQKRDLVERLKIKRGNLKKRDPNFDEIQVQKSPTKKPEVPKKVRTPISKNTPELENLNEQKLKNQRELPGNSTSYFIDKFCNSKKEEERVKRSQQELLSARVHTFRGSGGQQEHKPVNTNEVEEYSDLWVSQRYISKEVLRKVLHEIKILRLNKLFSKVKPPKFTEPQYSNWAAVGIISTKGEVKFSSTDKPKKYFKFTLTNFQYSVDVYIFGKGGVERYYNLRVGDVIAILNPEILPWRPSGKGSFIKSFNLRISHNFPCILEIGQSRDISWCKVFNKSQNKPCGTPINKSREECCEFHREVQFRSVNAKRIELNGSFALGAPTKIEARPALYRERSGHSGHYKVLPNHSQRGNSYGNAALDGKGIHFSNTNAAKAFFDEKYQNPDILNNLESKRRKIKDSKKSLVIDRELKMIIGKKSCTSLSHDNSKDENEEIRRTTEATLQSGLIQNLGFDPTHGKIASVLKQKSSGKSQNEKLNAKQREVSSLLKFKKETVNLKPSKEAMQRRKEQRRKAWEENFGQRQKESESNSSASDLEIV